MSGHAQPRGTCAFCELETTRTAMSRHLAKCPRLLEAISQANEGQGEGETLLHLRVQDAHLKEFWLDLEMRGGVPH